MAHHDLLDRVAVLAATDPEAYRRIQRAEERLARFYREGPGWTLVRTRALARLMKEPAPAMAGHGLPRLTEPGDYALVAWILWYGERLLLSTAPGAGGGEAQFILSDLAEELIAQTARVSADNAAPALDLRDHRHRASLVRALRALEGIGAIRRLHATITLEEWESEASGNILYEFTPLAGRLLASVDAAALTPLATGPAHPRQEPGAPAAATPLQRAWRALLLGPVFCALDDPEAFAALQKSRSEVASALGNALGWDLDLRQGYALVLRDSMAQYATDAVIARERRSIRHPVLLLAALYRWRVQAGELRPDADGVVALSLAVFESDLWALQQEHGANWGVVLGAASQAVLVRDTLAEMRAGGLLRGPDDEGRVHLLPALARLEGRYAPPDEPEAAPDGPAAPRAAAGGDKPVALSLF